MIRLFSSLLLFTSNLAGSKIYIIQILGNTETMKAPKQTLQRRTSDVHRRVSDTKYYEINQLLQECLKFVVT